MMGVLDDKAFKLQYKNAYITQKFATVKINNNLTEYWIQFMDLSWDRYDESVPEKMLPK